MHDLGSDLDQLLPQRRRQPPASLCIDCVCVLDDAVIQRDMGTPGLWSPALAAETTTFACIPARADSLTLFQFGCPAAGSANHGDTENAQRMEPQMHTDRHGWESGA